MTTDRDEKMLQDAFAQMREQDLAPSDDLLNRIMLDADSVLASSAPVAARPKASFGAMVLDLIGGWPSLGGLAGWRAGGLAAATVAGLWIGVVQPTALSDLSPGFWGDTYEVPLLESDVFAGLEG